MTSSDGYRTTPSGVPRSVLVVGSAALAVGLGLTLLSRQVRGGHPIVVVKALVETLRAPNLDALETDTALGYSGALAAQIETRGEAKHRHIDELFSKELELGGQVLNERAERTRRLGEQVQTAGATAFAALSEADRWLLWTGEARLTWLYKRARANLNSGDQAVLPEDSTALDNKETRAQLAVGLGAARLGADDKKLFDQVVADRNLMKDPGYAGVVATAQSTGESILVAAEARLRSNVTREISAATPRPDHPGAVEREDAKVAALGRATLTADDLAFLNEADGAQRRFGRERLSEAERLELGTMSFESFNADTKFVEREGRILFQAFLTEWATKCKPAVVLHTRVGQTSRSVLRTGKAVFKVDFPSDEACGGVLPDSVSTFFVDGSWKVN